MKNVKLVRSRTNKQISGVIGGIAPLINIDVSILRLTSALATLFTGVPRCGCIHIVCDNHSFGRRENA